jgi:hypothetical protein
MFSEISFSFSIFYVSLVITYSILQLVFWDVQQIRKRHCMNRFLPLFFFSSNDSTSKNPWPSNYFRIWPRSLRDIQTRNLCRVVTLWEWTLFLTLEHKYCTTPQINFYTIKFPAWVRFTNKTKDNKFRATVLLNHLTKADTDVSVNTARTFWRKYYDTINKENNSSNENDKLD